MENNSISGSDLKDDAKQPPKQEQISTKLPPKQWRPERKRERGKLILDRYKDKISGKAKKRKLRLQDKRKKLRQFKVNEIRTKGRYKCTIRQCQERFFSKCEQIVHTKQHQDALDYGYQRQQLSDLLWNSQIIKNMNINDMNLEVIELIVEYVNPTEIWHKTRPPIGDNPICNCQCICGYQMYQQQKQEELQQIEKMRLTTKKQKEKLSQDIESKYFKNAKITQVAVGKIVDMISFKIEGPDPKNIKVHKHNRMIDPLQTKCICLCYCGSQPFGPTVYFDDNVRYIDKETIQRAHTQNVRKFFLQTRSKFPLEKYPRIRQPVDYAKYHFIYNSQLKYDMLIWQSYPIPRSLTIIERGDCKDDDEYEFLKQESRHIFKQICCIQGHCMYRNPRDLPFKIIEKGIKFYPIRDEIYFQIIKQTQRNPNEISCLKGWKLLYLCLSSFTPSYEMGLILLSHITKHARQHGIGTFDTIQDVARHCYYKWINCMKGEIEKIEIKDTWKLMMRKREKLIHVKIHCFDGSFAKIAVPNSYTIAQTVRVVMEYFGLNRFKHNGCWLIRGISNDIQANIKLFFTSPTVSLLHLTSRWYQEIQHNENVNDVKFVLYRRVWNIQDRLQDTYIQDPAFCRLIARQCLRDFNEGVIQTNSSQDAINIIAISITLYHKATPLTLEQANFDYLRKFIPKWLRNKFDQDYGPWIAQIVDIVNTLVYYKFAHKQHQKLLDDDGDDNDSMDEKDDEMKQLLMDDGEQERHDAHLIRLRKQLIVVMTRSDYFGLSLFCGNLINLKQSKKTESILKINQKLLLITTLDHSTILYQHDFDDIRDIEIIYVEYQECLKFVLFIKYEDEEDLEEITEEIIFETDEAKLVCDLIGDLLHDTNDKYSILY